MASPSPLPDAGQRFGPYILEEVLGSGGMGAVYRARHDETGALYALKIIRPDRTGSNHTELLKRFQREAQVMARVDRHPGIVKVHSFGYQQGIPWLALELVEGQSLYEQLQEGPLDPDDAVRLVSLAARAVHHAHQHGVVHRDLKPHNLLVDPNGQIRVVDFGIAHDTEASRITQTGDIIGTPNYLAPEQLEAGLGEDSTLALSIDVYALGGVLYALLTGRPPFGKANSTHDLLVSVIHRQPMPPSAQRAGIPAELDAIVLRCLAKDPADRYASADDLADDLDRWRRGEPLLVRVPGPLGRWWLRAQPRTHTTRLAAVVTALSLAALVFALGLSSARKLVHLRTRRDLAVLEADLAQGGDITASQADRLNDLVGSRELLSDPDRSKRIQLLEQLARLTKPDADAPAIGLELARLVRPSGQLDGAILERAKRLLANHGQLLALHHMLHGESPEAVTSAATAADLARLILTQRLTPPVSQASFNALMRGRGLTSENLGQLLILRGDVFLADGEETWDQALDAFLRAWNDHGQVADNTTWPQSLQATINSRFLASLEADPKTARALTAILARAPQPLPPLPKDDYQEVVEAAGLAPGSLLDPRLNWQSRATVEHVLTATSFLELHGQSLIYSLRSQTLYNALGEQAILELARQALAKAENPARQMVLARLLMSKTAQTDSWDQRLKLTRELLYEARKLAPPSRWLLAAGAWSLHRSNHTAESQQWALAALDLDRRFPLEQRWPVIPLLASREQPTQETVRLLLEAAKIQAAREPQRRAMNPPPWPLQESIRIGENLADLGTSLVNQGPPVCCHAEAEGLDAGTLLSSNLTFIEQVPDTRIVRRWEALGDIHWALGRHEANHRRWDQAKNHLEKAVAAFQQKLELKPGGHAVENRADAVTDLHRVRAALSAEADH